MDGPKPLLRRVFIASLTLTWSAVDLPADDFIRPPTRAQTVSTRTASLVSPPQSLTPPPAIRSLTNPSAGPLFNCPSLPTVPGVPRNALPGAAPAGSVLLSGHPELFESNVPSTSPIETARAELPAPAATREELAARISGELLTSQPSDRPLMATASLEPAPGWQAVGEELKGHLDKCEALLSRHAYLSAREEANRAILRLVRVLDLRQNKLTCEPAWGQAQQALREAEDFTAIERLANDTELFTRLIQSHETPALREADVAGLTPLAAAQHYRAYAEKCLTEASQGHPWFSELYYCIGRTLQAQGDSDKRLSDALMQQALTYYRSAYAIHPANANNSNQLGYVLLRMDRPREAFVQLSEAVRLPNCPLEGWQNLVQASSRLGDQQTAQWAAQNYAALRAQGKESSAPTGTLVEVDPRQFAAMSPYASGPRPSMMPTQPPAAQPPAQSQPQAPPARTAAAPATSFFR